MKGRCRFVYISCTSALPLARAVKSRLEGGTMRRGTEERSRGRRKEERKMLKYLSYKIRKP